MKRAFGWGLGITGYVFLSAAAGGPPLFSLPGAFILIGGILIAMGADICRSADEGRWPWQPIEERIR